MRTIEDVARAMGDAPRFFQLYWSRDRELTRSFIRRTEASGYSALVVTLDTRLLGWRPRDLDLGHNPFLHGKGQANYTSDPVFRASLARPPEEDLHDIARTLGNFSLLVKGDNPIPLGANEEIAAALRGKNKAALRALPDGHRVFNARGQLVDRWDTPLYFHAESRDRLDVRSAGPDRKMWTTDDLHRKHDGRFLRGAALLAPSLVDAKPVE